MGRKSQTFITLVSIPDRDLGRLRLRETIPRYTKIGVSIPDRDLGRLRLGNYQQVMDSLEKVSIPDRDLGRLRQEETTKKRTGNAFQSLIGI